MADLLFVATTVAFFLVATGFVTLCDRIVGGDSPSSARSRPSDVPTIEASETRHVEVTELRGTATR